MWQHCWEQRYLPHLTFLLNFDDGIRSVVHQPAWRAASRAACGKLHAIFEHLCSEAGPASKGPPAITFAQFATLLDGVPLYQTAAPADPSKTGAGEGACTKVNCLMSAFHQATSVSGRDTASRLGSSGTAAAATGDGTGASRLASEGPCVRSWLGTAARA